MDGTEQRLGIREMMVINQMFTNLLISRSQIGQSVLDQDGGPDINKECRYPAVPTVRQYKEFYDREGIATRVINVFPDECFSVYPEVYETERNSYNTAFERKWQSFEVEHNPWSTVHRADELSGIGHFGIILFGLDDIKRADRDLLAAPVKGVTEDETTEGPIRERELLYMQTFDESFVTVSEINTNPASRRFMLPTKYTISIPSSTAEIEDLGSTPLVTEGKEDSLEVHWSRILHLADNKKSSKYLGVPRLRPVLNRLYDLRKILSGSGEMFWRGAFPGWAFEALPDVAAEAEIDEKSIEEQFQKWQKGLQRYLALIGVTVKPLAPNVADPTNHVRQQLEAICAAIQVPIRVFMGSEAAHLASTQDIFTWNRRLARRQTLYLEPDVIRPFVNRLQLFGVLPKTAKPFKVAWRDLNALSDTDKAKIALQRAQALFQYVGGRVEQAMIFEDFLVDILSVTPERAKVIVDNARKNKNPLTDLSVPAPSGRGTGSSVSVKRNGFAGRPAGNLPSG